MFCHPLQLCCSLGPKVAADSRAHSIELRETSLRISCAEHQQGWSTECALIGGGNIYAFRQRSDVLPIGRVTAAEEVIPLSEIEGATVLPPLGRIQ